ncbi:hypothetical protein IE077_003454 [Cardiosporidium cionae]|uniref:Uncharacterized protein n=1 Tax=Cardiosporidium cionae TaxID=476202 RepID=A0ABQ7J954_9APIC|nr:hypothetical protein IE077_003454 [Cardiosporidium cionae]|eukprot:KAF8820195.1 hypothetical protein IE077_003454 [Cardiosporidium cionae]
MTNFSRFSFELNREFLKFYLIGNMLFGNPYKDNYPAWIWRQLRSSRKGKDALDPFYRAFNATRIYDYLLKKHSTYWIFGIGAGMVITWGWGLAWNRVWQRVNAGKLYIDCPYVYPEDDL